MIRINQIKLPIFEINGDRELEEKLLRKRAAKLLRVREDGIRKLRLVRRSVDAREKNNIRYVYVIDVKLHDSLSGPNAKTELSFVKKLKNRDITAETEVPVQIKKASEACLEYFGKAGRRPVIIGSGPCGLFAAHTLCRAGLSPIIVERGERIEKRQERAERFFETGNLNEDSNVQFGEGGAGTFSDGKLNTSIKGQGSYIRYVLRTFCEYGADENILFEQKPHIGTDVLADVVKNMREDIIDSGGTFLFETKLCDLELADDGALSALIVSAPGDRKECDALSKLLEGFGEAGAERGAAAVQTAGGASSEGETDAEAAARGNPQKAAERKRINLSPGERCRIPCSACILAVGHSARDTFSMLYEKKLLMEQKPFAMGLRVQHPQALIDRALYGAERLSEKRALLGAASYKLTHRCKNGRSIYSFCMCPGGYVVNASSEAGRLCVNGMSYQRRDGENANAALIVNVQPSDFPSGHPLAGIELQRELEARAFSLCGGAIPCETYGDFKEGRKAEFHTSSYAHAFKGFYACGDLRGMLPEFMQEAVLEGMEAFAQSIEGFSSDDAILSGVEARTSSPVRLLRDAEGVSSIAGLYPAGEGAGYAGGITSAAVDGIKTAERLLMRFEQNVSGGGA